MATAQYPQMGYAEGGATTNVNPQPVVMQQQPGQSHNNHNHNTHNHRS